MAKVLVTGGAGYIGSHTVLCLVQAGYEVVVLDNLSTGFPEAVLPPARLIRGDLADVDHVRSVLQSEDFTAVVHFAASIVVPESVSNPLKYYQNNTSNTTWLIRLAAEAGVSHFIFSSTAAVYGLPENLPVAENAPVAPINPYGRSKLMSEWVLQDVSRATPEFKHVILRYFNVAGADPDGRLGQSTPNATHLIKVACQTALGQRENLDLFGTDYPTPDGTGVRDYIHVTDLARAHVLALNWLEQGNPSEIFNCGYGHGFSVRDIISAVQDVSGCMLNVRSAGRRPGDPAELVAAPGKIAQAFNWTPEYDDLRFIVRTAYAWEQHQRFGAGQ
ncbi:UDP-glucose 4-epimerase GalE [Desulfovermiculus halophilus]|uniref:UDP-glucose 4-epimerase GalE n=1 Tax=Desulfovermiculus halophilus TaxID=339722 RepID=UPI0004807FD9|nr:UDP-glucose 4-epimerase GalE [Desulfovermiculus halophilus]